MRKWWDEDQKWRLTLKRRRQRIERLERQLRHVENLPAVDVDRYVVTAGILKSRVMYCNDYIGLTCAFVQTRYGMFGLQVRKKTLTSLREKIYGLVRHGMRNKFMVSFDKVIDHSRLYRLSRVSDTPYNGGVNVEQNGWSGKIGKQKCCRSSSRYTPSCTSRCQCRSIARKEHRKNAEQVMQCGRATKLRGTGVTVCVSSAGSTHD